LRILFVIIEEGISDLGGFMIIRGTFDN